MNTEIKQRIQQVKNGEVPEGYKRDKKFVLPILWETHKLNRIIESLNSGVSVNSEDEPCGINEKGILKTSAVNNGAFNPNENKKIKANDLVKAKLHPKKDSIIISRMNTPALVGEIGYVAKDYDNLFIPDRLWQTNLYDDNCSKWLANILVSSRTRYQIKGIASGTSNSMKNISQSAFLSLEVCRPPLPEQQKIAAILSTWDKAIALQERLIAQKKEQKRGLMQRLLTGKVRLPCFDGEWKHFKASRVFESISDKKHSGIGTVLSSTQENGIVPRDEVDIDIKYNKDSLSSYKKVLAGQYVISLRSFQGGIEYSNYEGLLSPAYTILSNVIPINDSYYKHLFKSNDFITRLNSLIYGIRDGKQIGYKDFSTLVLPYPSLEEQKGIGAILDMAESEIEVLEKKSKALKEQKRGLMQLLLTGIVRVKV